MYFHSPSRSATTDTNRGRVASEELYDLETDSDEQNNRADDLPDRATTYQQLVERRLSHEREVSKIYEGVPTVV
jgi:hypothetical protein